MKPEEREFIRNHCEKMEEIQKCELPPAGWSCSRGKGHEGPCAATRTGSTSDIPWHAYISWRDHNEFVGEVLQNAPDYWDDDIAAEAIALQYVRYLESEVLRLGGALRPQGDAPEGEQTGEGEP